MDGSVEMVSGQPKFSMHPTYRLAFCSDTSEPEQYFAQQNLLMLLISSLDSFIKTNQAYNYLRSIDINKFQNGDEIVVIDINKKRDIDNPVPVDQSKKLYIKSFDNKKYTVVDIDGNEYIVDMLDVRPVDEFITKIKNEHIVSLYNFIYDDLKINDCTCIDFFFIFTEYFRIDDSKLYSNLPKKHQLNLLNFLDERIENIKHKEIEIYIW